jgi:glycosyltransferase involved in cell wall biosynthesis
LPRQSKNLLLVSYYFPPMGMGGVQRAAKTAKYFARAGWNVTVLAAAAGLYLSSDNSLLDDIPQTVKVVRIADLTPPGTESKKTPGFIIKRAASFWSRLVRLPDSKLLWSKKALKAAEKIVTENSIEYLLTTSPPPSVNTFGLHLKQKFNLKWLADFRDPWFSDDLPPLTPLHKYARKRLESKIMKCADIITTVTSTHHQHLMRCYPDHQDRYYFIPNGYDPEDLETIEESTPDKLVITHCGTLCSKFSVEAFFDSVLDLIRQDSGLKGQLRFEQVGAVSEDIYQLIIERYSPHIDIKFYGYLEHKLALEKLAQAWAVVVFSAITPGNRMIIPGKLYEGLALSKPLLGVFEKENPAATLIHNMQAAYHLDPDDPEEMKNLLRELIILYRSNTPGGISRKSKLKEFTRQHQAQTMARLLEG